MRPFFVPIALVAVASAMLPSSEWVGCFENDNDDGHIDCVVGKPILGECEGGPSLPAFVRRQPLPAQHVALTAAIRGCSSRDGLIDYDVVVPFLAAHAPSMTIERFNRYIDLLKRSWTKAPSNLQRVLLFYNKAPDAPWAATDLWQRIVHLHPELVTQYRLTCDDMLRWYGLAILPEIGHDVEFLEVDTRPDGSIELPPRRLRHLLEYALKVVELTLEKIGASPILYEITPPGQD
jgi:hypothetical protein